MDRLFDLSLAERRSWCLAWQVPVLVLTIALDVSLALAAPDVLLSAGVLLGSGLVLVVSVVALWMPVRWLYLVPVLDIVAIASTRSETADRIAGTNTSALVPIICLGFCFGRAGLVGAVLGACLVSSSWYLRTGTLPEAGTEWISLLALPAIALALGFIGFASSSLMDRQRQALDQQAADRDALLRQVRRELDIRQAVLDSVHVAVAFFTPEGKLLFANRPAVEAASHAGVDVRGPSYRASLVWRADGMLAVPYEEQPLRLALRGEEFAPELLWTGPEDERVASLMSARQVTTEHGERLGVVVVSDEVTELVEAVRIREEFLATLSHELRTPLNGMLGFLDMLVEDLGGDPTHGNAVRTVRDSALRLSERISQLLMASSAGRMVVERNEVQVADLVGAELARQAPHAENRGVLLEGRLDPVIASLDPHLFGLVVQNLLSNALKHTPPGGTTRVELRAVGGVELIVSDTGSGMRGHERERAFDAFYRAASARRNAVQGVGLGLTIVRAVVEAHGGECVLTSDRAAGTTVTVRIPAGGGAPALGEA
ncbi:sensor histidine kinase [Nocardioides lianchengensis]|uniref:histidine kinase n=1 Tax=Nocardioides lianchengensis TaxID=1045774 RepID=A0A1G7ASB4_9ACTN|nr:HAMP domain-containing sensor histidine kinase [Nocardioides lianchengensis]NYG13274.1 signal transduction histidine kinase [Nocardioides lianchengensis]SDE17590.1 PAS fold-containing protein [Nocardioides lianchengensis]